jgi:hypothetical protein
MSIEFEPGDKVRYTGVSGPHAGVEGVIEKYMYRIKPYDGGHWPKDNPSWIAINEDTAELIERKVIEI